MLFNRRILSAKVLSSRRISRQTGDSGQGRGQLVSIGPRGLIMMNPLSAGVVQLGERRTVPARQPVAQSIHDHPTPLRIAPVQSNALRCTGRWRA